MNTSRLLLLMTLLVAACWQRAGDEAMGALCISEICTHCDKDEFEANSTHATAATVFTIFVDDSVQAKSNRNHGPIIRGLNRKVIHRIKILQDGKAIASFRFSFKKLNDENGCLWYNAFYGTWNLWPLKGSHHLCHCDLTEKAPVASSPVEIQQNPPSQ